jgi:hypothetical protein
MNLAKATLVTLAGPSTSAVDVLASVTSGEYDVFIKPSTSGMSWLGGSDMLDTAYSGYPLAPGEEKIFRDVVKGTLFLANYTAATTTSINVLIVAATR